MNRPAAIERCAYCGRYVPITPVHVVAAEGSERLAADLSLCDACLDEDR